MEYALILGLLVAVVLVAIDSGVPAVRDVFGRLSVAQQTPTSEDSQASQPQPKETPEAASAPAVPAATPRPWRTLLALSAVVVTSLGLAACSAMRKRAEVQAAQQTTPTLVQQLFNKRQRVLRFLSTNTQLVFQNRLLVRHLMTSKLECVSPQEPVEGLHERTRSKGIHHLLVVDDQSRLVGILSDRDLLGRKGKTAADIMTPSPHSVSPETPLCNVLTLLLQKRISCVPVVDGETLCGILTSTDAMLTLQCIIQALERVGMVTQGMLDEEIQVEGTLQGLLRLTEMAGAPALASPA